MPPLLIAASSCRFLAVLVQQLVAPAGGGGDWGIQASGWWEGALQNGYVWMGRMGQAAAGGDGCMVWYGKWAWMDVYE